MKPTRGETTKTPLQKTIEMWEVLAETGMTKEQYFSREGKPDSELPTYGCYLCEEHNINRTVDDCTGCPIAVETEKDCGCQEATPYEDWRLSCDEDGRREYARQFVEYLKTLPESERREE